MLTVPEMGLQGLCISKTSTALPAHHPTCLGMRLLATAHNCLSAQVLENHSVNSTLCVCVCVYSVHTCACVCRDGLYTESICSETPCVCVHILVCVQRTRMCFVHLCTCAPFVRVRSDPCAEDLGLEWSAGGPVCTELSTSAFL